MRTPFQTLGIDHWQMPDLIETLQLISNDDEAAEFMGDYEAVCGEAIAVHNMRYMLAILASRELTEAQRIADVFMVELPGRNEVLSPEQTFGRSSLGVDTSKPIPTHAPQISYVTSVRAPSIEVKPISEQASVTKPKMKSPAKKKMTRTMLTDIPVNPDSPNGR